jgi:SlyX protein
MTGTETSERFVLLETKIAYQEKLLHELSDLLREKGQELDRLTARVLRLESAAADGDAEHLPHERPPHY